MSCFIQGKSRYAHGDFCRLSAPAVSTVVSAQFIASASGGSQRAARAGKSFSTRLECGNMPKVSGNNAGSLRTEQLVDFSHGETKESNKLVEGHRTQRQTVYCAPSRLRHIPSLELAKCPHRKQRRLALQRGRRMNGLPVPAGRGLWGHAVAPLFRKPLAAWVVGAFSVV